MSDPQPDLRQRPDRRQTARGGRRATDLPHGRRSKYQAGCRCPLCGRAEAAYRAALRRQHLEGKRPLGTLVSAKQLHKHIKSLRVEGFSLAEIARRLGLPCQRLNLDNDRTRLERFLEIRALYRKIMLEGN
jgi:hypothetical protein